MPVNINEIRDHAIVQSAVDALEAGRLRLNRAKAALETAKAEQTAAFEEARAAVLSAAAGDEIDPHEGAEKYAKATIKAEFCAKILFEVEDQVAHLTAARHAATGASWQPVHDEGRKIRLQAAKDADAARSAMKAAQHLWNEGTELIQRSHAADLPRKFDGTLLAMNGPPPGISHIASVPSEAQEAALWADIAHEEAAQ